MSLKYWTPHLLHFPVLSELLCNAAQRLLQWRGVLQGAIGVAAAFLPKDVVVVSTNGQLAGQVRLGDAEDTRRAIAPSIAPQL